MSVNYKELEETLFKREFLSVKPGCDLQVRLLGNPIKVFKLFTKDSKCAMFNDEETARKLKNKYPGELKYILKRYYCWCIDRADEHIKILDMLESVATVCGGKQSCYPYYNISGYNQGYDWRITTNGKLGTEVRYTTVCVKETPLSYDEIEFVDVFKSIYEDFELKKTLCLYSFKKAEKILFNA